MVPSMKVSLSRALILRGVALFCKRLTSPFKRLRTAAMSFISKSPTSACISGYSLYSCIVTSVLADL